MKEVTPDNVRKFLLAKYSEPITAMRLKLAELPDDFDFLLNGVIDSFGILEMISAIESEFRIQLDLAMLDAEDITRIGPLTRYIAATAKTLIMISWSISLINVIAASGWECALL